MKLMTKELAVVTGAGTGIGRALSHALALAGFQVLGVGRRLDPLKEMQSAFPEQISIVSADVAAPEGRTAIVQSIPGRVGILVHNAAVLGPVEPMATINPEAWRQHMAINVDAPLFLTQALLGLMDAGSRILHISSGAAHGAYQGWGAYCTSKCALNMMYRCLDLELREAGIRVGSVRPGVVDTPMQDTVRGSSPDAFPDLSRFIELKESGTLVLPEHVASYLVKLLTEVEADAFAEKEWDFRDHKL